MRFVRPGATQVYRLPAGFEGVVASEIGTGPDADVELLDADCQKVDDPVKIGAGSTLILVGDGFTMVASPTGVPSEVPDVWAEEIRGECGS